MKVSLVRPLIVLLLMLGAAALSVLAVPTRLLADSRPGFDLESSIPKAFGDWKVDPFMIPIPPSPDQESAMSKIYDQILSRTYVNSKGERIMLSITYGSKQNQQMRAHRQEVCYSAQGFRISQLQRLPLTVAGATVPSARMVATQGQRIEPVTYWFTMGDDAVMSYLDRELTQLRYALAGKIPDGYLVRVSSLSSNPTEAFEQQLRFVDALMMSVDPELRRRFVGSSA
ncbi:MAG: EpsI family protein [Burkholderiales bacterium]|nr:EpsI family protein [Burkholderiales bacterium]